MTALLLSVRQLGDVYVCAWLDGERAVASIYRDDNGRTLTDVGWRREYEHLTPDELAPLPEHLFEQLYEIAFDSPSTWSKRTRAVQVHRQVAA